MKEIEEAFIGLEHIERAVVLSFTADSGLDELCAYIQAKRQLPVSEMRERLSERLPSYMIPSYFVTVDKCRLRRTESGPQRAAGAARSKWSKRFI
ncbi:hypothetical protein PO124_23600 [Bacillus licheniformis]|nr:hypothetical protein [Bacillus licheniformis]